MKLAPPPIRIDITADKQGVWQKWFNDAWSAITSVLPWYDSGDIVLGSTKSVYIGDKNTDGSWKFVVSGDNLLIQKRVSDAWITKQTITG
jgi:hypothetical protein